MMNRFSLDRFRKAQSAEPFSVSSGAIVHFSLSAGELPTKPSSSAIVVPAKPESQTASKSHPPEQSAQSSCTGGGQSNWQPPDWAVEPRPGLYWLEVVKDGEVVDRINLEKRRHLFGRQAIMCDFVLDHPSVSRQHAAVVQHKNGSVYVIDLGSVHGTFVANERLSKDSPTELEVGQSLRFAASTRSYVLRKGVPQVPRNPPINVALPPSPDPSDEEAVVAYNTLLNKLGLPKHDKYKEPCTSQIRMDLNRNRPTKKPRKAKVTFRDQYDGVLVEVVGISDGADVSTDPGPLGVKEGSLVGNFDGLVEITIIPKDKDGPANVSQSTASRGVTEKLQQYLEKVKSPNKGGLYEGLYEDALPVSMGSSWANNPDGTEQRTFSDEKGGIASQDSFIKPGLSEQGAQRYTTSSFEDDLDDLFGDVAS